MTSPEKVASLKEIEKANAQILKSNGGFLVASFPRSGSTLTRNVFCQSFNSSPKGLENPLKPSSVVQNFNKPLELHQDRPMVARTHRPGYIPLLKTLFLFRSPADALWSFYSFSTREDQEGDVDEFLSTAVVHWRKLARAALKKHRDTPSEIQFSAFETFKADPVSASKKCLDFMMFPGKEHVAEIVGIVNGRFSQSQKSAPSTLQPVRGVVGEGKKFFNAEQIELIDKSTRKLHSQLRKIEQNKG